MTFILNESDIETAQIRAAHDFHRPNLQRAVLTLARLMEWTNSNSDGWAYWQKPLKASTKLQGLVSNKYFSPRGLTTDDDLSAAQVRNAETTIKGFLTRQKVDHKLVFPND